MSKSLLTNARQRKLLSKYGAILESGKKIESENTKLVLAQLLENTRNFYRSQAMLNEAGLPDNGVYGTQQRAPIGTYTRGDGVLNGVDSQAYRGGAYGDYYLPNIVMPMLRRIIPDLIANELVAVQPLNGPVGYAIAYRPTLAGNGILGDGTLKSLTEIGYNPTDTRYSGISPLSTLDGQSLDGLSADMWNAYAGNDEGAWKTGAGADIGVNSEFATLHDGKYPQVTFGLVKSAVEAKTRKLAAHWSPELAEDMQAMHGLDVEREMINTLTYEVGAEIDRQIITEMVKAAILGGSTSEWSPVSADGLDQMGRLATLLTQITVEANQIAIRTRRGNANFVVTTPRVCALLQQLSMNKFTSFKSTDAIPT